MVSLSIILALVGFYMLYSTSKRAKLILQYNFQKWITKNPKKGKTIGLSLLIFSLLINILSVGFGSGIFSFLVIIMTMGSLVVLISPIRFFNISALLIIAIVCLGVEFLIS
jgi:hypothetical protein